MIESTNLNFKLGEFLEISKQTETEIKIKDKDGNE